MQEDPAEKKSKKQPKPSKAPKAGEELGLSPPQVEVVSPQEADTLLVIFGLTPESRKGIRQLFKGATNEQLAGFSGRVVRRLNDAGVDTDTQVKNTAPKYLQAMGAVIKSNAAESTLIRLRAFMQESKNNPLSLAALLMFPDDSEARQRFEVVCSRAIMTAAEEKGIALGGLETFEQRTLWSGKRYPVLAVPAGEDRPTLLAIIHEEIEAFNQLKDATKETGLQQLDHRQLFDWQRQMIQEQSQALFAKMENAATVEVDFNKLRRPVQSGEKISLETAELEAFLFQQFNPESGEFYRLDPVEATRRLENVVRKIGGIENVPAEIQAMLSLAALAPDRGLVEARKLNSKGYIEVSGIMTLAFNAPDSMRDLREKAIIETYETENRTNLAVEFQTALDQGLIGANSAEMFKTQLVLCARDNVVKLLSLGLASNPSPEFVRYFFEKAKALEAGERQELGRVDIIQVLLEGGYWSGLTSIESNPYQDFVENGESTLSVLWQRDPDGKIQQKGKDQQISGIHPRVLGFLGTDSVVAEEFYQHMKDYVRQEADPQTRIYHLSAFSHMVGYEFLPIDRHKREMLELLLELPEGQVYSVKFPKRGPTLYDWFGKETPSYDEAVEGDSNKRRIRLAEVRRLFDKLNMIKERREEITQELLTGADMGLEVEVMFQLLRKDPDYQRWEAEMRERAESYLQTELKSPDKYYPPVHDETEFEAMLRTLDSTDRLFMNEGETLAYTHVLDTFYERYGRSLSHVQLEQGFEAIVKNFPVELVRRSLVTSKDHYSFSNQKKWGIPVGSGTDSISKDSLNKLTPEKCHELISVLGEWKASFASVAEIPFFQVGFDRKDVEAEIEEMQKRLADFAEKGNDLSLFSKPGEYEAYELSKLMRLVIDVQTLVERRREENIPVIYQSERMEVRGGQSPRLIRAMRGGMRREKFPFKGIIPSNISLGAGTCLLISGPAGAGKSAYAEAVFDNLGLAERYLPYAKAVIIPETGKMFEAVSGKVGFDFKEEVGKSTFMVAAERQARHQGKNIAAMDEPGRGAPTEWRIPLVVADVVRKIKRRGFVFLTSHEGVKIAESFQVLGLADNLLSVYVTPDESHEVRDGIGGSFALQMLRMQEVGEQFIGIAQEYIDAAEANLPPGSLSLKSRELPPSKEAGFASRDVLENAHLIPDSQNTGLGYGLKFFIDRAGGSDRQARRLVDYFTEAVNAKSAEGRQLVSNFEQKPLAENKLVIRGIKQLDSVLALGGEEMQETMRVLVEGLPLNRDFNKAALVELYTTDFEAMFQTSEGIEAFRSVVSSLPELKRKDGEKLLNTLITEVDTIQADFLPDMEAFTKHWKDIGDYQRARVLELVERNVQVFGKLDEEWEMMIKEAREAGKTENCQAVFYLLDQFMRTHRGRFISEEQLDFSEMIKALVAAKKKLWQHWLAPSEKTSKAAAINECQKRFNGFSEFMADDLDGLAFGSFVALSTRQDNQDPEAPFCVPENRDKKEMPFVQQLHRGKSLYLVAQKGSGEVVGQDLFVNEDGQPMKIDELPDKNGEGFGHPIDALMVTGVQGEGKTEVARLLLQNECFRQATGRVMAEKAWMAPEPTTLVANLRPAATQKLDSTFMVEAGRIAKLTEGIGPGAMVFCDEPGQGVNSSELVGITTALADYTIRQGGTFVTTNHHEQVYDNFRRLSDSSRISWYPVGYEFTRDRERRYRITHGEVCGAATLEIAQEQGFSPQLIDFARFLHQMQQELEEHKKRVL